MGEVKIPPAHSFAVRWDEGVPQKKNFRFRLGYAAFELRVREAYPNAAEGVTVLAIVTRAVF